MLGAIGEYLENKIAISFRCVEMFKIKGVDIRINCLQRFNWNESIFMKIKTECRGTQNY